MKKIKLFIIIGLLILTTGCASVDVEMKINNDKSINLVITEMVDEELLNEGIPYIGENDLVNYENSGFLIKNYVVDDRIGYQFTRNIENIDDVSTEEVKSVTNIIEELTKKEPELFTIKKGLFKNKYTANYDIDSLVSTLSVIKKTSNPDLNFTLRLPNKALSSNANSTHNGGKTLTWDLTNLDNKTISFEFEMYNYTNIIIVGLIAVGFITYFISSTVSYNRRKKKVGVKRLDNTN